MYYTVTRDAGELTLALRGNWRAATVGAIETELAAVGLDGVSRLTVDPQHLDSLDISGAWLMRDFARRAAAAGVVVDYTGGMPEPVRLVEATLGESSVATAKEVHAARRTPVAAIGRRTLRSWDSVRGGLAFVGELSAKLTLIPFTPARMRFTSITRHVYDTGITAIPIVALIAFLISVITAYMGAQQLRKFGADIFVVDLVTVGVLREMGVLLTAIIVAGRSGSAFAAEIGAMRLNEEVDALQATGVDPIEVLIIPRIFGLVIALPLLTVIADAVGLAGGALLCRFLLDMPLIQYINRVDESIGPYTFWVGIIKAPVFALLIAAAGVYRGLQVRGSSRELGRLVTVAVVQAIFLVILADAIFAVIFMELDI
jgi:phospholipid/cholesterol/gamma-HCH transport system permease protein